MKKIQLHQQSILFSIVLPFLLAITFSASSQIETTTDTTKTKVPSRAIINTMNGGKIKGWLYKIDTGNVYLLPARTKALQPLNYKVPDVNDASYNVEALQINTIVLKKRNEGLKGAWIGFGAGAVIGAIIGFSSGDDPVSPLSGNAFNDIFVSIRNSFAMSAGEKAAVIGITGGAIGALIGGITGALLKKKFIIGGKKTIYQNSFEELNKRAMVKF